MWIGALALIIGGIAIVAAASMARAGRLSRQSWIGIRTRTTMASDEAWYAAHRDGAGWVMASGVLMALGGVLTLFVESEDTAAVFALVTVGVSLVALAVGASRGQAAARRIVGEQP